MGVYDKTILCHDCEQIFQETDNYGQELLLNEKHEEITRNGSLIGYRLVNVNYSLIKLFFISILWRASVSSQEFYKKVNLGKYENIAKKNIEEKNPGEPCEFSFILTRFTDEKFGTAMLNPHRERWDNINYYRFYLYGYGLHIKVDKRKTANLFCQFELKNGSDLIVTGRDIAKSKELKIMHEIVHSIT